MHKIKIKKKFSGEVLLFKLYNPLFLSFVLVLFFSFSISAQSECDALASGNLDTDQDGVSDICDLDDDNDGVLDTLESDGNDPDGDEDDDGTVNYLDNTDNGNGGPGGTTLYTDSNSDGIPDVYDFDGDGIPNHLDLDSDNDGIYDILEAGGTDSNNNGIVDNLDDLDNDGLADIYDNTCQEPITTPASTNYATAVTASNHFTNPTNVLGIPGSTFSSGPTSWPGSNPFISI